ncbi:MAG: nucleoside-diphosphate sugar epimerase/dehydratase [candidate division WOR-3 bacterium]
MAIGAAVLVISANLISRDYRLARVTFSVADLRRLFSVVFVVTLLLASADVLLRTTDIVLPNPLLWGINLFLFLSAFRGSKRLLVEPLFRTIGGKRTLVVMSTRNTHFLPNFLRWLTNFGYHMIGIVDPDPSQVGSFEQSIEVVGNTKDIVDIVERHRAEVVLVSHASTSGFSLDELYSSLKRKTNVEIKTIPSPVDIIQDHSNLSELERLCIHELTGRPPVTVDVHEMRQVFSGKNILITGAGGSIGAELCRQLARFEPARLVLFERDDSSLFGIERELRSSHTDITIVPFLGDITRPRDLETAFRRSRPELVFHAAAYKHVPILEFHPAEAVRVNVIGTHNVLKASVQHGTSCLIYISTDKAVNPTSTMGATKRLGEMIATAMNGLGGLRTVAVRFGNVLDSRGSVTSVFRNCIIRRHPITVTDRNMRRYFMLTSEAVVLVLQAANMGHGGEVFVLDMGKPVRIWDLAHRMVELSGLTPNVDIPIITAAPRPGEKLFEELLTAEEGTTATSNSRIFRARTKCPYDYSELLLHIENLATVIEQLHHQEIKNQLARIVPNYRPDFCHGLAPSTNLPVTISQENVYPAAAEHADAATCVQSG